MFGSASTSAVTAAENLSRSTASAPPAATRAHSAASSRREPRARISSLSRPEAESGRSAFSELEQTSSAKPALLWAGENRAGFCSYRSTATPRPASQSAASQPASPAPMTVICMAGPFGWVLWVWGGGGGASAGPGGPYFFSTGLLKPQPSLAQYRVPRFLNSVAPQLGQVSGTGSSQVINLQVGKLPQP